MIYLLIILSVFLPIYSEIIETAHFQEVKNHITPETLLIVDIDDTLIVPEQTLGTDVWFEFELAQNKQLSIDDPLDKTLALWEAIRHLTKVKIVEEETGMVIAELQKQDIPIMALTSQGLALATRTINQLHSTGFDLSKTAPCKQDCYFDNGHGVLFRKGILFSSGTNKGDALLKFFDAIGICPKKVIFIDDKLKQLQSVEQALNKKEIPFIGLRYNFSDKRIANFRPEIADIQLRYSSFNQILSDQEAEKLLNNATEWPRQPSNF